MEKLVGVKKVVEKPSVVEKTQRGVYSVGWRMVNAVCSRMVMRKLIATMLVKSEMVFQMDREPLLYLMERSM